VVPKTTIKYSLTAHGHKWKKLLLERKKQMAAASKVIGIVEETQLQAIKFVGDLSFWLTGQRSTRIRPTYILIL